MPALELRVEAALATRNDDRRWDLIGDIAADEPDVVFELAVALLSRPQEGQRVLGADILGQLATRAPEVRPTAAAALLEALRREFRPAPVASIVTALGHVADCAALEPILALANHAFAEVRLAVAFALAAVSPQPPSPDVVEALICLSRDPDREVRDWATFGLGTLSRADGPEVRDALVERSEDAYPQARAEALFGLVLRRDPHAVPALIRALQAPAPGALELEAAAEAGDPRLLPALHALERTGRADRGRVALAIERCSVPTPLSRQIKATPWNHRKLS